MHFVFKKCERRRPPQISKAIGKKADAKSRAKLKALKQLRALLDAEEPQTALWLQRMWKKQQAAITYKDLKEAILSGDMTPEQLDKWREDYAQMVNTKLAPQWAKTMAAAAAQRQAQFPHLFYNPSVGAAQEYIQLHGAELVTNLAAEQRRALQAMISRATHYDGMTVDDLARIMRPVIGLTTPQAKANLNFWAAAWKAGAEAGLSQKAAMERANQLAATYAARQHRSRAMNIARTELAAAYNQGAHGAITVAQGQGYIGDCKKTWLTADDERVCGVCGALDGESVNMEAMFSNGVYLPPAHPGCRCAVAYEEVTAPLLSPEWRDTGAFEWIDSLSEEQKIDFLGDETKAALFDAGLLSREDYFKPLKAINLSGIMIPDKMAMTHSTIGDYIKPSAGRPGGRLAGGGHTDAAMVEMDRRGIVYNVLRTNVNGVRFGNVPDHRQPFKRSGEKQTWFPQSWTEHDIMSAGIYAANKGIVPTSASYAKEALFKNVMIRVDITGNRITTVHPSYDQP